MAGLNALITSRLKTGTAGIQISSIKNVINNQESCNNQCSHLITNLYPQDI
jgi:hypothetical protein